MRDFLGRAARRGAVMLSALAAMLGVSATCAADGALKPVGDVPVMHEEATAAGLNSVYDGPWEFFVGGGGAAFDCDGSGFPSVFLAGGKNPAKLYVNVSNSGGPFKFVEKPIDIDPKLLINVIGAYPIDVDGDGHMDLFVLRVGANLMLKGGPELQLYPRQQGMEFRRGRRLDDVLRRRMGAGPEIPDACHRPLHRP